MAQIKQPVIDVKVHRRVLRFLNAARRPEDLMVQPQKEIWFMVKLVIQHQHYVFGMAQTSVVKLH